MQVQSTPAPIQTQTSYREESSYNVPSHPDISGGTGYQQEVPEPLIESDANKEPHPESAIPPSVEMEQIAESSLGNSENEPSVPQLQTSCRLGRVEELLKDIRRVLVGTRNSLVRGGKNQHYFTVMNDRGELPWMIENALPYISIHSSIELDATYTDATIVGYLNFYNIGGDFIETDGTETFKKGCDGAAHSGEVWYNARKNNPGVNAPGTVQHIVRKRRRCAEYTKSNRVIAIQ
ncbi:hypothetical protein B0J17DRAFT_719407 [Rhizoctonia solani]|nr:hypothetical protein B0J17DRAFT_719407 [Rhizoctonia solani]